MLAKVLPVTLSQCFEYICVCMHVCVRSWIFTFFIFVSVFVSIVKCDIKWGKKYTHYITFNICIHVCVVSVLVCASISLSINFILHIFRIIIINDNVVNLHVCLSHKHHIIIHVFYKTMDCIILCAATAAAAVLVGVWVYLLPHHSHTTCIHNTQIYTQKHIETRAHQIGPISNL